MLRGFLRQIVACALSIAVPMFAVAETLPATATGSGHASINSTVVKGSRSVVEGDHLETSIQSNMTIAAPGGSINLSQGTRAIYGTDGLSLGAGMVHISTKSRYGARYKNLIVRPVSQEQSQYEVGELNGIATVAALRGGLTVSDGTHSVMLPEGRALQQEPSPAASGSGTDSKTESKKKEDKDRRRGGAVAVSGGIPGWLQVLMLGGATAGTFGGLALAGYFDKKPTSPTVP